MNSTREMGRAFQSKIGYNMPFLKKDAPTLNHTPETPLSEHERSVIAHYDKMTRVFYLQWSSEHFHFGLFKPGERPRHNETPKESDGHARALERMVEVVVAPAGIERHHHVVDAGCGVGGTAFHLARTRGCRVTGVNLSQTQLEIAGSKAVNANLSDRIDFEYANCSRSLPFADGSVDVVVNIESARHYNDRRRFLHEVYRILKPGGCIVASDWMVSDVIPDGQYQRYIQPLCEDWMMYRLESQSSYTRLLQEAGLEVIEFEGFSGLEFDNLHLLTNTYQSLGLLRTGYTRSPAFAKLMTQLERLCVAWRHTYMDIKRYCAVKA